MEPIRSPSEAALIGFALLQLLAPEAPTQQLLINVF